MRIRAIRQKHVQTTGEPTYGRRRWQWPPVTPMADRRSAIQYRRRFDSASRT